MKFVFETHNPFEHLYPGRKVIGSDHLVLAKILRSQGHEVVFSPDDGRPTEYLFKKGHWDFLHDPLFLVAIGVPLGLLKDLIAEAIKEAWNRRPGKEATEPIPDQFHVYVGSSAEEGLSTWDGTRLVPPDEIATIRERERLLQQQYALARLTRSPFPRLPSPVFVQHKPRIVAWCRVEKREKSIATRGVVFTDPDVLELVKGGILCGLSIGGIASDSVCAICKEQYVVCNHISGQTYNGSKCINTVRTWHLAELSLVDDPINPECVLELVNQAGWTRLLG